MSGRTVEYAYTDISPGFTHLGKNRFARKYPFARFMQLGHRAGRRRGQGFEPGSYHVVLASNVLHATRNIKNTVHHARQLLRPGGFLILNEATSRYDFSTLTFGLTEGWWRFEDGERRLPHSPLLDEDAWQKILAGEGFDHVQIVGGQAIDAPQSIVTARAGRGELRAFTEINGAANRVVIVTPP